MTYIALLRGISVGGHNVKMDLLRGLFEDLGFDRVRSYIQTGNVFFESREHDTRVLRTAIERHLRTALGYEVATCMRTVEDVEQLLVRDPFIRYTRDPGQTFSGDLPGRTRHRHAAVLAASAIRMAIEPPYLLSILRRSGVT